MPDPFTVSCTVCGANAAAPCLPSTQARLYNDEFGHRVHSARTLAARHTADDERTLSTILTASALGALVVAPGVYELPDEHCVYAVPSASTDRVYAVVVNTRTGAMRCDGPHCDGRTCSHQKRVRAARAGF